MIWSIANTRSVYASRAVLTGVAFVQVFTARLLSFRSRQT